MTVAGAGAERIVIASHRPELRDYPLGPNAARVMRHANALDPKDAERQLNESVDGFENANWPIFASDLHLPKRLEWVLVGQ